MPFLVEFNPLIRPYVVLRFESMLCAALFCQASVHIWMRGPFTLTSRPRNGRHLPLPVGRYPIVSPCPTLSCIA